MEMPSCVRIKTKAAALRAVQHWRVTLSSRLAILGVSCWPTVFGISCSAVKSMNRLFVLFLLVPRRSDATARERARKKSAERSDGRFAGNWMLLFRAIFSHATEQPSSSLSFFPLLSNSFIPLSVRRIEPVTERSIRFLENRHSNHLVFRFVNRLLSFSTG